MYIINFLVIYALTHWVNNSLPFKGRVGVGMGESFTNKINPSPS